jgi:hypothetical protein
MLITEIGNPEMNSYVSSKEAADYFYQRSHAESWDDIDNYDAFLISASNQIDWYLSFPGTKVNPDQPLEWPREGVFDTKNQSQISSSIIPRKIKYAVLELVLSSIDDDRIADSDMAGLQEVKVGSLKVVSNLVGPWQDTKATIPDVVYKILDGIVLSTGSMFRRVIRT